MHLWLTQVRPPQDVEFESTEPFEVARSMLVPSSDKSKHAASSCAEDILK
jgi:hypothetical protein